MAKNLMTEIEKSLELEEIDLDLSRSKVLWKPVGGTQECNSKLGRPFQFTPEEYLEDKSLVWHSKQQ
jgi:hypothetical protein